MSQSSTRPLFSCVSDTEFYSSAYLFLVLLLFLSIPEVQQCRKCNIIFAVSAVYEKQGMVVLFFFFFLPEIQVHEAYKSEAYVKHPAERTVFLRYRIALCYSPLSQKYC